MCIVNCREWHPKSPLCLSTLHEPQKQWRPLGCEENTVSFTNAPWNLPICLLALPELAPFISGTVLSETVFGLSLTVVTHSVWGAEGQREWRECWAEKQRAVLSWNVLAFGQDTFFITKHWALSQTLQKQRSWPVPPHVSNASQALWQLADMLPHCQNFLLCRASGWEPLGPDWCHLPAQESFLTAFASIAKSTERTWLFFRKPGWTQPIRITST